MAGSRTRRAARQMMRRRKPRLLQRPNKKLQNKSSFVRTARASLGYAVFSHKLSISFREYAARARDGGALANKKRSSGLLQYAVLLASDLIEIGKFVSPVI
jgi:hypothetical protein